MSRVCTRKALINAEGNTRNIQKPKEKKPAMAMKKYNWGMVQKVARERNKAGNKKAAVVPGKSRNGDYRNVPYKAEGATAEWDPVLVPRYPIRFRPDTKDSLGALWTTRKEKERIVLGTGNLDPPRKGNLS